jgi:2-dehydro-3-deoxyphosphogluconate aldolase/(4S)-4-hydroxy-2-oxoglutarate aldolase
MTSPVTEAISHGRVVSIVRERSAADARAEVGRLVDAGARVIEVSLGTPGALDVVRWMVGEFAGRDVHFGVGTVRTVADVDAGADAGAAFAVSPLSNGAVVAAARARGLVGVFGAMTPSECYAAAADGSEFVKLFPARVWSPKGLKDLLQALPDLRIVPTGGVSIEDADAWLDAGAAALGLGGALRRERSARRLREFYHRISGGE